MKERWFVATTGFALFSMFFGSGNLVFPITVGFESGGHYLLAALGILLTGVLVPFLGVLGMILYRGDITQFFNCFGKRGTWLFSFLALALMGPFGVLARCITVVHGALQLLVPNLSLPLTSLLMCGVIYLLTVNKNQIINRLGTFLTPFLLASIAAIAFFGIYYGSMPQDSSETGWNALTNGFFQGYQTMDLLAAFFFSQFIIKYLHTRFTEEKPMLETFYLSSFLGAGILSLVYLALVTLGWIYSPVLAQVAPQEMLGTIALASLGSMAAPCVCLAVIFACLTTAMVLASLFADFLRQEIAQNKIGNPLALGVTLAIGFVVSTFDFAGIAKFLGPVLEAVYPALIVLTAVNIACHFMKVRSSIGPSH